MTVSPLGARGPLSVSSWAASPPAGRWRGEKGWGPGVRPRTAASPRRPAFAHTRSSPHLATAAGRKAAIVCSLPSGDRGVTSGPGAWPLETQEASPRQGSASVFSDGKGATVALKSGGHGASPQLSKKQGFLPTCQSHRGHEILP